MLPLEAGQARSLAVLDGPAAWTFDLAAAVALLVPGTWVRRLVYSWRFPFVSPTPGGRCWLVGLFDGEEVSGLAIEYFADRDQRREANRLRTIVLEDRKVHVTYVDLAGKLGQRHPVIGEQLVEVAIDVTHRSHQPVDVGFDALPTTEGGGKHED